MKKYVMQICIIAAVCLLGATAFCGYHIYDHYAHEAAVSYTHLRRKPARALPLYNGRVCQCFAAR